MVPDIFISPGKSTTPPPTENPPSAGKPVNLINQKSTSPGLFAAYTFMPQVTHFETQEPGETILLLLRRHFVTNVPWLLISFILLITPIIIFPLISFATILPSFVPASFVTFLILVWYLLTFSFILTQFLLWYFNVWIVTSERVVDIDFSNLIYKSISETRISKIEDITEKTGGFIRSVFDYGDVFIQTAGTAEYFIFYAVPHPGEVVRTINELMGTEEEEKKA